MGKKELRKHYTPWLYSRMTVKVKHSTSSVTFKIMSWHSVHVEEAYAFPNEEHQATFDGSLK